MYVSSVCFLAVMCLCTCYIFDWVSSHVVLLVFLFTLLLTFFLSLSFSLFLSHCAQCFGIWRSIYWSTIIITANKHQKSWKSHFVPSNTKLLDWWSVTWSVREILLMLFMYSQCVCVWCDTMCAIHFAERDGESALRGCTESHLVGKYGKKYTNSVQFISTNLI